MTDWYYIILLTINLIGIITAHESGHYFVHKYYKRAPTWHWSYVDFNINPYNQFQLDLATVSGVVCGILSFIFLIGWIPTYQIIILFVVYLYACRDDLFQLGKKYNGWIN